MVDRRLPSEPPGKSSTHILHSVYTDACLLNRFRHVGLSATLGTVAARLLCPWGFSRQEYWSEFHALLQGIFSTLAWNPDLLCLLHWQAGSLPLAPPVHAAHAKSLQPCLTLCNPMDRSPPGSSVLGILQARILKQVAIPFSRGSSRPRDRTWVSCIAGGFFTL